MSELIHKPSESNGTLRYETLFGIMTPVIDMSYCIRNITIPSRRDLTFFKLDAVVEKGCVFIGFGQPNVYLALPSKTGFTKFDAKYIKRSPAKLVDTRNLAQSGLLFKMNLSSAIVDRLYVASRAEEGLKRWTCVNANARVLKKAGFHTKNGVDLASFYFPMPLAREILRNGFYHDGEKINVTPVKTVSNYLERFALSVLKSQSQWKKICSFTNRITEKKAKWINKAGKQTKKNWPKLLFGVKREKGPLEKSVVLLKSNNNRTIYPLQISYPALGGVLFRWLWGPHSFFTISPSNNTIDNYHIKPHEAYEAKSGSVFNFIKQNILFRPIVIRFMRHYLMKNKSPVFNASVGELFNMIRTHTGGIPNKYNIVITSDQIIIMKIGIKYAFVDWVLSKHVLSSGYSKNVLFAGEIWKDLNGIMFISNDSGTYAPNSETLNKICEYLTELFFDVEFKIVDASKAN